MNEASAFAPIVAAVAEAAARHWPEHAVEDLTALLVLGMDVDLAALSPKAGATLDAFLRRAGLVHAKDPDAALAAYLERHPIPAGLVAVIGAAARAGLVEHGSRLNRAALSALGGKSVLKPVQGRAGDAGSLLQLRLRGHHGK